MMCKCEITFLFFFVIKCYICLKIFFHPGLFKTLKYFFQGLLEFLNLYLRPVTLKPFIYKYAIPGSQLHFQIVTLSNSITYITEKNEFCWGNL